LLGRTANPKANATSMQAEPTIFKLTSITDLTKEKTAPPRDAAEELNLMFQILVAMSADD